MIYTYIQQLLKSILLCKWFYAKALVIGDKINNEMND